MCGPGTTAMWPFPMNTSATRRIYYLVKLLCVDLAPAAVWPLPMSTLASRGIYHLVKLLCVGLAPAASPHEHLGYKGNILSGGQKCTCKALTTDAKMDEYSNTANHL